ncbi:hypothetical protein [Streptomyces sp. NPDC004538]|uniref:hypothetical protein n=1 Tax=unclassified Streptomyces TaxID=2593676 RepID=UPI00339F78F0
MASWFQNAWRGASPETKKISLILPAAGTILVSAGALLDIRNFWQNMPFLVNITSSIAAACFGVPFVLLFIGWISKRENDSSERAVALSLSVQIANEFEMSSLDAAEPGNSDTVRADLAILSRRFRASAEASRRLMTRANSFSIIGAPERDRTTERYGFSRDSQTRRWHCRAGNNGFTEVAKILEDLANEIDNQNQLLSSTIKALSRAERSSWIARVRYQWEALERSARPRLAASSVPWIPTPERILNAIARLDEVASKKWEIKSFQLFNARHEMSFKHILEATRRNNESNIMRISWIESVAALSEEAHRALTHFENA